LARSRRLLLMGGSDFSYNDLFFVICRARLHNDFGPRALISCVCGYRLFKFRRESVQVFGRFGKHFAFPVRGETT
jgi:hypothetical protein